MFSARVRGPWPIQSPGWRSPSASLNVPESLECSAGFEAVHRRARPCWRVLPAPRQFHVHSDGALFPFVAQLVSDFSAADQDAFGGSDFAVGNNPLEPRAGKILNRRRRIGMA